MVLSPPARLALDLDFVRGSFPALLGDWVYLDNAGGSQTLATVADRVRDYLLTTNVQLGATYEPSRRAAARVAAGRAAAAELFGSTPGEVILGGSSTQLLQNFARSIGEDLQPGDEVVVTDCDHEANVTPWLGLAEKGAVVRWWKTDLSVLALVPEQLEPLLSARTRWVCFPHVSNLFGTIHPVREIVERIHAAGARAIVDGVAFAPHRHVEVDAWGADAYVASLYKIFGPHLGALFVRHDWLEGLANVNHAFIGRQEIPYKLQPGNANFELAASLPAIKEYLDEVGRRAGGEGDGAGLRAAAFAAIAEHEGSLAERLLAFLRQRRDVWILGVPEGDAARRVATVSFAVEGRNASDFPAALDGHSIGIRYGDFHSRRLVQALGLTERQGVVRISMAHYNTVEEIDRTIDALVAAID
ncbi:MAG: cysteine desulfurase-like protein [Acidobacteriota bacterium]